MAGGSLQSARTWASPGELFDEQESKVVDEAYAHYRFGSPMLEVAIRKMFKIRIFQNRIHMHLKATDLARRSARWRACPRRRRLWMRTMPVGADASYDGSAR